MSRPLRDELASCTCHVTSRGNGREDIYLSDSDRLDWLDVDRKVRLYESESGNRGQTTVFRRQTSCQVLFKASDKPMQLAALLQQEMRETEGALVWMPLLWTAARVAVPYVVRNGGWGAAGGVTNYVGTLQLPANDLIPTILEVRLLAVLRGGDWWTWRQGRSVPRWQLCKWIHARFIQSLNTI